MAQQQPARRKLQSSKTPVSIPDKLYFRIGDVARLCSLPAYVLRFWETEFPQLKPNKGGTGQRLYRKRDVEVVLRIKDLLYNEGFTIAGARRLLAEKRRSLSDSSPIPRDRSMDDGLTLTAQEQESADHSPSRISKPAISKAAYPLSNRPDTASQPKIKELREEMRALLTLLGSDQPERSKSLPASERRDAKKARRIDEPTLF